ncbi:MAG: alpha-L-fucosidase [Chloroflexi bacterium]|nr:alpha-L-fucosidase [Chloroflexota bacterium]
MTDMETYLREIAATRSERMRWWHEARFGMFVHWGLYSQLGRHEWVMNRERIPVAEYEKLADTWQPGERPAREWARLARQAGMKYMVMTTKHHEGFCLWDTDQTEYNSVKRGPRRDLVREYVEACREFGLKIGFYYSLMDWHHPDGARCARDGAARRRFLDFTQGCVRELCTNYGKIDIMWYDVSWPLESPERWETVAMNRMVRELQPHIIINDRAQLPEDFGTPEEQVRAAEAGRSWEACMTFNGSWGYMPISPDWRSVREVVDMLCTATAGGGNLLLNIGPRPDGSVPEQAVERLGAVGAWISSNGDAIYGHVDRTDGRMEWMPTGRWTLRDKTAYFWCNRWPGEELTLGGLRSRVARASLLTTGAPVAFQQTEDQLVLGGLPVANPDGIAGVTVIKLECETPPTQMLGAGCVVLD